MKLIIHSQALGGTDLEAEFEKAENSEGIMLLFHNASGDMNNEILVALASACFKRNISSLRCNFHYVNGVGSEKAEWKDVAYDAEAIYAKAKELDGGFLYVGGKSLGTLAALYLATLHSEIKAVGLFAVPIRMIEKYLDLEELSNIKMPVYVFHGDDDKVGTPDEVESCLLYTSRCV